MNMADITESGDLGSVIVFLIITLVTGGVGAAIVQGFFASKRGVRGDALVKEKNALDGYKDLQAAQQAWSADLERRLTKAESQIESLIVERSEWHAEREVLIEERLHNMQHIGLLEDTLGRNEIPIPARPVRGKRKRENL